MKAITKRADQTILAPSLRMEKEMSKQTNPWQFHTPTEAQKASMQKMRDAFQELAHLIQHETPVSRQQSVALTHLEDAAVWANKAACQKED